MKESTKKLSLNKETLKRLTLTPEQLRQARGGGVDDLGGVSDTCFSCGDKDCYPGDSNAPCVP